MKQLTVIILLIFACRCDSYFAKFNRNSKEQPAVPQHTHSTHSLGSNNSPKIKRNLDNFQECELKSSYWIEEAQLKLKVQLDRKTNENIAKNILIFLGDGMSLSTITGARIYAGQMEKKSGEENLLSFEKFPHVAMSKTYCVNMQVADSACSATAYLTGVKGNYQTIGVNANVELNDCKASLDEANRVSSIMKWAQSAGKATGIVTTTRITHASPAGTYAHTAHRDWESDIDMFNFNDTTDCSDIALQLITEEPGKNFNVIFGGARKKFLSEKIIDESGSRGERLDGRDLIDEWLDDKRFNGKMNAAYVHNRKGLLALNQSDVEHVLGLFADSHLDYHLKNNVEQPTLSEMTESAIEILKKNENGFVLFVEGGLIDIAHHENQAHYALDETAQFADAIQCAMDMTNESETLTVVTADHAHTMSIAGYSHRGENILGLNSEVSDVDSMPYMTISYSNGPSGSNGRHRIDENEMSKFILNHNISFNKIKLFQTTEKDDYRYPSLVPLESETHGGEDVLIYARGPFAHLFDGVLEQNTIPHFLAYAACIGDGLTACDNQLK